MKRYYKFLGILLMLMVFATCAYAGIYGTVAGYIKGEAVSLIIGAAIGSLGIFGLSYKLWGQAVRELGECLYQIYAATRATSNGGKEITKAEMEKIIKEATEVYPAVAAAIASHKSKPAA